MTTLRTATLAALLLAPRLLRKVGCPPLRERLKLRSGTARAAVIRSSVGVGASRTVYPPQMVAERSLLFVAKEAGENALVASGLNHAIIRNAVLRDLHYGSPDRARLVADERRFGVVSRRGLAA